MGMYDTQPAPQDYRKLPNPDPQPQQPLDLKTVNNWAQMHQHAKLVVQATNRLNNAFTNFFTS